MLKWWGAHGERIMGGDDDGDTDAQPAAALETVSLFAEDFIESQLRLSADMAVRLQTSSKGTVLDQKKACLSLRCCRHDWDPGRATGHPSVC